MPVVPAALAVAMTFAVAMAMAIAHPAATHEVIVAATVVPMLRMPRVARARHDLAPADPDVPVAVPPPVTRRPNVARRDHWHRLIDDSGRRCDHHRNADSHADAHLCKRGRRNGCCRDCRRNETFFQV